MALLQPLKLYQMTNSSHSITLCFAFGIAFRGLLRHRSFEIPRMKSLFVMV